MYTPRYNAGSPKLTTRYRVGGDKDADGVDDVTELTVGCTDPGDASSY